MLYQGSNICNCRMFLKSNPSAAALVINTTLTSSPFLFSGLVIYFKSARLFGENDLSPVIITYLAGR